MSHGPTKIASKGACIYCKRSDVLLTNEHIVPESLGGQHILLDGSCRDCAKITTKFERDVARDLWGDARISYNAPSKRSKKKRKTHIILEHPQNAGNPITVPYAEYPAPMIFYQMYQAGLLQGCPEHLDISGMWKLISIMDHEKTQAFEQKHPGRLTAKIRHIPNSFGRLIAKIGYANVFTFLDLDDFQPICLSYILDKNKNVSFVVGSGHDIEEPNPGLGYKLGMAAFGTLERIIIISEVRLIANNSTPSYHVIVGDVTGHEKVQEIIKKLGSSAKCELFENAKSSQLFKENHWSPHIWPLPFWATKKHNAG